MSGEIGPLGSELAILIAAGFATLGWLYTARRARTLSRKQHTVNIIVQAYFNKEYREALTAIASTLRPGTCPDLTQQDNNVLLQHFRMVMNHYEFLGAGIRNGDFDEQLLIDSQRGSIVQLVETCRTHIYRVRDSRRRQAIYEHIEWLYNRWEKKPPGCFQRIFEWCRGRPCRGERVKVRE